MIEKMPVRPIFLRPLLEGDFTDRYLGWFRDEEVTRYLEARNISRDDAVRHLQEGIKGNHWRIYAICEVHNDRHIGNVKIGPIQWRHGVSDLVTVIGERDAWGKGYAREAIGLAMQIAFNELNLRKLSASINARNIGSLKAYGAAGFEYEATLKDHLVDITQGEPVYADMVFVACFNPAFSSGRITSHKARGTI